MEDCAEPKADQDTPIRAHGLVCNTVDNYEEEEQGLRNYTATGLNLTEAQT